jgi:hypothetical protein
MTYIERQAEIQRLKSENRNILATPLMSEGNISPMQVNMFSKRQREQWQNNAMQKMNIESQIKALSRTDEEINLANHAENIINAKSRLLQIHRQGEMLLCVGIGKTGKLKPSYQKELDIIAGEKNDILTKYPEMESYKIT